MSLVVLSIAVLFAAPLIATVLLRRPSLVSLLDSFVLVTVGGIVALHVVPQSASLGGPAAIGAAIIGLFLPIVLHRLDAGMLATRGAGRSARDVILLVAFLAGTLIHALFDGTALAGATLRPELALGVILHRVPVGLALWVIVRPKLGVKKMLLVVAALAIGTVMGSVVGTAALDSASAPLLAVVQAFVGGSILHIVAESPPFATPAAGASVPAGRAFGFIGVILAVATLAGLEGLHQEPEVAGGALEAGAAFLALALDTAPALLLSFLLVGVLTAIYPAGTPTLRARGPRVLDAAVGVAAGLPHPLCACTVSPMYTQLLDRGASPASARAFLVAAPELGVPAVLLTARLFGLHFTVARVVGAAVLALLAGALSRGRAVGAGGAASTSSPLRPRLVQGLRHGLVDAVDHVAPWVVLGLGVAALLEPSLDEGALAAVPAPLQTVALAVLALPLYLCAAGATPVAAVLVHKGVSAGAVLAFLLVGPAISVPTLALIRRLHGSASSWTFALVVAGGAALVGLAADPLLIAHTVEQAASVLHAHRARDAGVVEMASLALLAALVLSSLARQGVRGFLVQIMSPQHSHAHDHEHGPGCDHDHGPPLAPSVPGIRALGGGKAPTARVTLHFDPRGKPGAEP